MNTNKEFEQNKRSKRFLDIKELSEYMGLSINTLYSWVSQKRIPYVKLGRLVRFDLIQIEEWIKDKNITVFE